MLEKGKIYDVTYSNMCGTDSFVGMYYGTIQNDEDYDFDCEKCFVEGDIDFHTFFVPYDENASTEEIVHMIENRECECYAFCNDCISKIVAIKRN